MNVLVIGDEHTYGFGLSGGNQSYIGHFIRQISLTGQAVSVEAYAHLTMSQVLSTLSQLPLSRYDLIIMQLDQRVIQPAEFEWDSVACLAATALPYSVDAGKQSIRAGMLSHVNAIGTLLLSVVRPFHTLTLSTLLKQLRPYRHNVLLLTPFPIRKRVSQLVRKRIRTLLLEEADKQLFSVFDSDSVIRPREEYFLTDDREHLNAVSHELLGRALFDFYLSAPTIITIQTSRRE